MKIPTKINHEEKTYLLKKISKTQNNSIQRKNKISQEELILYSQQKIIKDIEFAKNTIPYVRNYLYFVGFGICICSYLWAKYYKNSNISFGRMLLLNLADLEKE